MAGINIGPRIGIEGEAQFRKELSQINQALKTLDSEGKLVAATMERETDAEKKNAAQKDLLERKMITQKEAVDKIRQALNDSVRMFGESDERTLRWQRSLNEATADLRSMENQLARTDGEVEEIGGDMQNAEKDTKGWADVMKGSLLSNAITSGFKVLKDAAVAAAKAIGDAAMEGAEYADDILTLSTSTHLGTETLQEYKYMADLIDVDLNTITGSLSKMTKQMAGARDGTGAAAEAWQKLGVRIEDDNGQLRKSEDVFNDTITALKKVQNETERDTIAMSLFGRSAQDLNPLIEAGGDKLASLAKEAHDAGYVLSGSTLKAMGAAKDSIDRLDKSTEAASNRFAAGLTPSLGKAADAINKTLASPRVKRGIDDASAAIGSLITGLTDLGMNALTGLLDVIGLVDPALRYLTDDELEFLSRTKDAKDAWDDVNKSFKDSADTISDQTQKTYDLWNELQTLTTETGKVKEADAKRAEYILGELNNALGTEYEMTGNQILKYQEMREEVEKLIQSKQAESLLAAAQEKNNMALEGRAQALQDVLEYEDRYNRGLEQIAAAEEEVKKAQEELRKETDETAFSYNSALNAYYEAVEALNKTHDANDDIIQSYMDANNMLDEYEATLTDFEAAQRAMATGSYDEAIAILTKSTEAQRLQLERTKNWQKTELDAYVKLQQDKQREIDRYEERLNKGYAGYTQERLRILKLENYQMVKMLQEHSYEVENAAEIIGEALGSGIEKGIETAEQRIEAKARLSIEKTIRAMKTAASIASPSKKTAWIGEMLGAGLTAGIERTETQAEQAAREAMRGIMAAFTGASGTDVTLPYSAALAEAHRPSYNGSSTTNNYTTSMGGITVHVSGANVDNVDQLAGLVAVKLNDELQRARSAKGAWK